MCQVHEDFWTDERLDDGHTYDHRVGETCPACGERPAIGKDGTRFGTYWDCALHKDAYDADALVAHVPAQYGDTATGRHRFDAEHIASWHPAVALAVADWLDLIANWRGPDGERRWDQSDSCDFAALAVARAYLKT
jgi:hypothetical protein